MNKNQIIFFSVTQAVEIPFGWPRKKGPNNGPIVRWAEWQSSPQIIEVEP